MKKNPVQQIIDDYKANRITFDVAVIRLAQHNVDGWALLPRV